MHGHDIPCHSTRDITEIIKRDHLSLSTDSSVSSHAWTYEVRSRLAFCKRRWLMRRRVGIIFLEIARIVRVLSMTDRLENIIWREWASLTKETVTMWVAPNESYRLSSILCSSPTTFAPKRAAEGGEGRGEKKKRSPNPLLRFIYRAIDISMIVTVLFVSKSVIIHQCGMVGRLWKVSAKNVLEKANKSDTPRVKWAVTFISFVKIKWKWDGRNRSSSSKSKKLPKSSIQIAISGISDRALIN